MKTVNKVLETIKGFLRDSFCLGDHIIDYLISAGKIRNFGGMAFGVLCYMNPSNLSKPDFMHNLKLEQERERRIKEQEEKEREQVTVHEEDCLSTDDFKNLNLEFRYEIEVMLRDKIFRREQIRVISKNSGIFIKNLEIKKDFFGNPDRKRWSIVYATNKRIKSKNSKTKLTFKTCKEFLSLNDGDHTIVEIVKKGERIFTVLLRNEKIKLTKEFSIIIPK